MQDTDRSGGDCFIIFIDETLQKEMIISSSGYQNKGDGVIGPITVRG